MKISAKKIFPILFFTEGICALIWFVCIPSEKGLAPWLPLSLSHLVIALFTLAFLTILAVLWIRRDRLTQFREFPAYLLEHPAFRIALFLAGIFFIELFFLTYILLPRFSQPFIIWATLICFQGWWVIRARMPVKPTSIKKYIQTAWREKTNTQRRTALILAAIGLVYFCVFIPLNSLGWNDPSRNFMSGVDEGIQYPIAVQTLTPGDTFASTIYHLMINESDVYGHPYVAYEAFILLIPRLVFGVKFGDHLALNLMLLRQFVNVLPILLSMFLLVYMVTRFRRTLPAVGLFLLLLSIPAVTKVNIRFLHPDSVILFLIVLTIYFLQRDQLRFKGNFYLAAVFCSLAAVIKLWGFFFFLAIFVYLWIGVFRKNITLKKAFWSGLAFIFVMFITAVLSNPGLLVPSVFTELINGLKGQIQNRSVGYSEAGDASIYTKDFATWMTVFKTYYLAEFYFYVCAASLLLCSLKGRRRLYSLITFTWCITLLVFMSNFLAAKSFWYALEVLVPLYPAPFLLPKLIDEEDNSLLGEFLNKPMTQKIIVAFIALCCGSQFILNIITIVSSPVILNYAH